MNKAYRRVISVLLAALLTAGTAILPISAGPLSEMDEDKIPVTRSQTIGTGIKPFTGTADLVRDTIADVKENSERVQAGNEIGMLAERVEEKSEYTLSEITSAIGRAFLSRSDTNRFDTSRYHLHKDEMEEVLERVFSVFYLSNMAVYTLETNEEGEVIAIEYALNDSFQRALDQIISGNGGTTDGIAAEVSAEAEQAAAEAYVEEYSQTKNSGETYALVSTASVMAADGEVPEEHQCTYRYAYEWDDDYKCRLVITCLCPEESGCENIGTGRFVSCTVTSSIDPETGDTIYTAEAPEGYEDVEIVGDREKTVPHTHIYSEPVFEWMQNEETGAWECSAVFTCTECTEDVISRSRDVECTVSGPEVDAANGTETWTAVCEHPVSGAVYESVKTDAHTHVYSDPTPVWNETNHTCAMVKICEDCPETVDGHKVEEACEVTASKPDAAGVITYTAVYNGEAVDTAQGQHVHNYGTAPVDWSWTADYSACTAVFVCIDEKEEGCDETVTDNTVNVACSVTADVNSQNADVTYQAACEFDGSTYTSAPITVEHEHQYTAEEGAFAWSEDYSACTATFVCQTCPENTIGHVKTESCHVETVTEENQITYIATAGTLDENGEPYTDTQIVAVNQHVHTLEANFVWEEYYDANTETYANGMLFYDPEYVPEEGDTAVVYYDAATGIGVSMARNLCAACNSAAITCTECGAVWSSTDGTGVLSVEAGTIGESAFYDPNTWTEYGSDILTAVLTYEDADGNVQTVSDVYNLTTARLTRHYAEMVAFNDAYPQYFGIAVPFWTDKNTDTTPFDAIKTLINQAGNYVPNKDMDTAIEGLTMAFISYVMNYGSILDQMLTDAIACLTNDMSDIQKMLVLHDWLAKNSTFDMNSLIELKSGGSGGDPITMTAFGTLLSGQFASFNPEESPYGAVCLGYAATYALLLQHAFPDNYKKDGEWLTEGADHLVDFVQIKFHANVAESSVAGANSGFGDGDAIFNEPHYFNAIRLDADIHELTDSEETPLDDEGYCWYYTDACYDDINVEVISQYRVETDGNISHMYFLNSPQSFLDMFDGNFDYFDSAYDGVEFYTVPVPDENGNPQFDQNMNMVVETDKDGLPIWYVKDSETEIAYADDQFEQTWFSNAKSEIIYYQKNWYYIEGSASSYSALKDFFGDDEEGSADSGDYGDMEMDTEQMLQYKNDPDNADRLMVRPSGKGDRPANANENSGGMDMSSSQYEDRYAQVLFHFGYGAEGPVAEDTEITEENLADYPWYGVVQEDIAYNNKYPDLNHSLAMMYNSNSDKISDGDGKLYFNLANRILVYDIDDHSVVQLKEYNITDAVTDGRPFEGMSFFTEGSEPSGSAVTEAFTVIDHPIASIMMNDMVYWTDEFAVDQESGEYVVGQDGQADTRNVIPALYVSVGTNYSNSFVIDDSEPYQVEAVNFNPDYYRFMEEEESGEETDEEENTNVEFMWCANIVDIMRMDEMLTDLKEGETEIYTMKAVCGKAAFTEERTIAFGLSDGTAKLVTEEEPALDCHYFYRDYSSTQNNIDGSNIGFICFRCSDYQERLSDSSLKHDKDAEAAYSFEPVWTEDGRTLESCIHFHAVCPVRDCPENSLHTCEIAALYEDADAPELVTGYAVTCSDCGETRSYTAAHEHIEGETLEYHEAVAATCTSGGNVEYWTCTNELCGRYFVKETNGETGETTFVETTAEDIATAVTAHPMSEEPTDAGRAATCTEAGMNPYWTCTACGAHFDNADGSGDAIAEADLQTILLIEIDPVNHASELEHHEAGAATCVSGGSTEYWSCSACEKIFSDAEGTVEIESSGVEIDPDNHAVELEHHEAVAATCVSGGSTEYWSCSACAKIFSDAEGTVEIESFSTDPDPHNHAAELEHHEAVAATCVSDGSIEYWNCSACGKNFSDAAGTEEITDVTTAIDPENHVNTEIINDTPATTTEPGYTGDIYCNDCETTIEKGEVIPVITLTYGDVNADGKITVSDAILIFRYIDGGFELNIFNEIAADVNVDGKITVSDAIMILRYIDGGFDVELGVAK